MYEFEEIMRERHQLYSDYIRDKKIKDPILQIRLWQKMIENCLVTLGKILDRTYKTLSPEDISKEMFGL